jgi:hypothetical protein
MVMEKNESKLILSESGMVTADFLFSLFITGMFGCLLFAMCFTFSIVEVTQYISYSATRAALSGGKDFDSQRNRAQAKVDQLLGNAVLAPLLKNGWFNVTLKDMRLGETASDYYNGQNEYPMSAIPNSDGGPDFYVPAAGVRLNLQAKVLEMNLGPLGKIESDNGDGFSLTIDSLMFREPSQQECQQLINTRYQRILNQDASEGGHYQSAVGAAPVAIPMEDTGC